MSRKCKTCFWCGLRATKMTKDHVIPKGMGGNPKGRTVSACWKCNQERGKVTELYNLRAQMLFSIDQNPDRITIYKNRFRKKVQKMLHLVIKWDMLHREKNIVLPFKMFEVICLDELMPCMIGN